MDYLPLKGVSTSKLQRHFSNLSVDSAQFQEMITRVIEMFSNNIENREGGMLYGTLINMIQDNFYFWTKAVWPRFFDKFQVMDCEGEFFQSLLKYWIPQNVCSYKSRFYDFVIATSVPDPLKCYVLLETRKRNLIYKYSKQELCLLKYFFSQENTQKLAFLVVCSFYKKNIVPSEAELGFVLQFLREQADILYCDEIKALYNFLKHLGKLLENKEIEVEYCTCLKGYLIMLFAYGILLLRTRRKPLGAQLLKGLYNGLLGIQIPMDVGIEFDGYVDDLYLKQLWSERFADCVEQALLDSHGLYLEQLCDLGGLVVEVPKIFTKQFIMSFIDGASNELSIKACDSVKNITRFVASVYSNQNDLPNMFLLRNMIYNTLLALFENDFAKRCPRDIFKAALLSEALNQVSHATNDAGRLDGIDTVCFPVVSKMLWQENCRYNQDASTMSLQDYNFQKKVEKILQALYNNLCEYLLKYRCLWLVDQPKLINELVGVIERSSMRRPTTTSADLLKRAASAVGLGTDREERQQRLENFKVTLLDETLKKLEQVAPIQNLTIRRNPETRLVLHALCLSDTSPLKHFLTQTLNHLLKLLSVEGTVTNATVAAALHCTEILMSDNSLYRHTVKYAAEVILACVRHFENRNWVVRNACLQLLKALIDRFLGVQIGLNTRSKSVSDLFQLFPQVTLPFFQVVTQQPLTDSALAVLQFFSESQLKPQPYYADICLVATEAFLPSFVVLIKENSDVYGLFAARVYVSLCLAQYIPDTVGHIVDFVIGNFKSIRTNHSIRNFTFLLQELLDKYLDCISEKPVKPSGLYVIYQNLNRLSAFLSHSFGSNNKQFDYLLVKIHPVDDVLAKLRSESYNANDYQQRMWLHNYLPFLVINADLPELPRILDVTLSKGVPDCLQVKALSIVVDRFAKEKRFNGQTNQIVIVLTHRALELDNTKYYLLMCYFKVVLLLVEECQDLHFPTEDLANRVRPCYKEASLNIYKTFIIIVILSTLEPKSDDDKAFVKSTLKRVQHLHLTDEDLTENVSEMLKYLYKNSPCLCDRRRILKLTLLILLKRGLWHFVSFITKSSIANPPQAMQKILNFEFLKNFFNSDMLAYEFVKEFYGVVCEDQTELVTSNHETYYVATEDVFVDSECVGRIVLKFLYQLSRFTNNSDWLEFYSKVRIGNKVTL